MLCLKTAKICLKNNLPFVIYKFPKKNKISITISKKEYKNSKSKVARKNVFTFSPFKSSKNLSSIFLKNDFPIRSNRDCRALSKIKNQNISKSKSEVKLSTTKSEYENNFKKYMLSFESESIKKAILSRQIVKTIAKDFDVVALFKKMNKNYTGTFNYVFFSPSAGLWAGASPEILIECKDNLFKTPALAGTLPVGAIAGWGEKEREEHSLVCDRIKTVYKKNHLKLLSQEETVELETGAVKHLLTNFTFKKQNKKFDFDRLLSDLHPTPAVAGYPKKKAIDLILKTEKYNREFYTGYLGVVNKKEARLFVNLRCAKIQTTEAIIYVGGGLTKDSNMEDEWKETELKSKTILNLL